MVCWLLFQKIRPEPSPPPVSVQPEENQPAEKSRPLFLESLSVEVMVDWEDTDRMLESLEELSSLLDGALEEVGCTLGEPATVTISTAGGITAQALARTEAGEAFLASLGLSDLRIRLLEDYARIQVPAAQLPAVLANREKITSELKRYYTGVLLDLEARDEQ